MQLDLIRINMEFESCFCHYEVRRNVQRLAWGREKGNTQVFGGEDVSFCSHNSLSKLRNKFRNCYWEFTMKAARKVSMNSVKV